jgi:hypothetical protein
VRHIRYGLFLDHADLHSSTSRLFAQSRKETGLSTQGNVSHKRANSKQRDPSITRRPSPIGHSSKDSSLPNPFTRSWVANTSSQELLRRVSFPLQPRFSGANKPNATRPIRITSVLIDPFPDLKATAIKYHSTHHEVDIKKSCGRRAAWLFTCCPGCRYNDRMLLLSRHCDIRQHQRIQLSGLLFRSMCQLGCVRNHWQDILLLRC